MKAEIRKPISKTIRPCAIYPNFLRCRTCCRASECKGLLCPLPSIPSEFPPANLAVCRKANGRFSVHVRFKKGYLFYNEPIIPRESLASQKCGDLVASFGPACGHQAKKSRSVGSPHLPLLTEDPRPCIPKSKAPETKIWPGP